LIFFAPLTDFSDTLGNYWIYYLTCISIYQDHPLVNYVSLSSELNLNRFQHFYASHNVVKSVSLWLYSACLIQKN
jgi:hypothetical protein